MFRSDSSNRSSVSEPKSTEAQEAEDVLHSGPGGRTGEEVPAPEVPRLRREVDPRQGTENDRRSGEDLVPEPKNEMEVSGRG